jgi:Ricin-type beta-trefoil lectin domain-like
VSAHRRSALRVGLSLRRRAANLRGRRRAGARSGSRTHPYRLLPVLLGVAVLGIGALAGPAMVGNGWPGDDGPEKITFAALPKDAPDKGMVYDGLSPAASDSLCAGGYEVGAENCTHGPDLAPAGLTVRRDVAPVTAKAPEPVAPSLETGPVPVDEAIVRDEGGSALTPGAPALIPDAAPGDADFVMGAHNVACEGDGRDGKRVQVLYLHEFGTPSRYTDFLGSIRVWSAGADQIFDASAQETGGDRHLRFVTTPQCDVDVSEVQVPEGALGSFTKSTDALQTLGYNRTDRKYLMFADSNVYCGIGTYIADNRPGLGNRNNGGPSYGRVDAGCWSSVMAAHEVTHMLGALLQGSPNASGAGGCTDDYDLLCGADRSGRTVRTLCPKKHENRLDCGHDDYFSTRPKPESYLAEHWNVANSEFLLRSDGGDDIPDAPGLQVPRSGAPKTVAPPADVVAAQQAPQAVLEVKNPTSTAVDLSWNTSAADATYEVAVDGVPIATTVATRAQLIGLKPDSHYTVTIKDAKRKYLAKATAQTAPAARPAQNSWFVLTNSLTGGAADLYAARTANGTPITLGESDGDAQEQWKLAPAGGNAFMLQSQATGKCVVPLGGNPVVGQPLVQGDCAADSGPRWVLQASDLGFTLRTAVGDLVVGVGAQRFGANRVLTLQEAGAFKHQSWTAVPN